MIETRFASNKIDILLLAEATYPFERGGVASWIYQIIKKMPQRRFGVLFLGGYPGTYKEPVYPLPENLVHLQIIHLFSYTHDIQEIKREAKCQADSINKIKTLHESFKKSHGCPMGLAESLEDIAHLIDEKNGMGYQQFLHSEASWKYITEQYKEHSTTPSFINYFWNILNMHSPLWKLASAVAIAPHTKIIHTISTGYAGLLGVMLHQRYQFPLILTEHGIYTKERNIDLLQSAMLPKMDALLSSKKAFTYEHQLWLEFFDAFARACYYYANPIISLYKAAQEQQIDNGARAKKTRVIPNGVDVANFSPLRRKPGTDIPKIVCFVGRIVRIKDIKTFIRAFSIMIKEKSGLITLWIKSVGCVDNEYLQECMDYIEILGLKARIHFAEGDMFDILPKIGLLTLSSISEGMPLVLLESLAAGVPVVTTDVGSCREIIEGCDEADKKLGKCGAVVSVGDAAQLAHESLKLLNNPDLWYEAQRVAIERVQKYYNETDMIHAYEGVYEEAIKSWQE